MRQDGALEPVVFGLVDQPEARIQGPEPFQSQAGSGFLLVPLWVEGGTSTGWDRGGGLWRSGQPLELVLSGFCGPPRGFTLSQSPKLWCTLA